MLIVAAIIVAGCNKTDEPNNGGNNGGGNNGNNDSDVRVTTYTPQDITATTAKCGGDAIVTQGLSLTELGVCWGKEPNPTTDQSHLSTTVWNEPFVCTITNLESDTKYYVRAYALRGLEYYYGEEKSFTTLSVGGGGGWGNHTWVDLGLPSGTLWATCNIGADFPEEYGDYFAWGETECKNNYDWSTYQHCMGGYNTLTKYCNDYRYGYNGYTDHLTTLLPEDDAATTKWGSDWRMPTREEWFELFTNIAHVWTTQNGVNGSLFTATNGNTLFLPAAGCRYDSSIDNVGSYGNYWLSSLHTEYPVDAWECSFASIGFGSSTSTRKLGCSVRPVCTAK